MVVEPSLLSVDGLQPKRVERPQSPEQLAEALRAAAERGEAVVPVGGARALSLGDPLERFDLALSVAGLDRIIELSQADMTVSVEAGVTLERLDQELARVGQLLPLDPPGGPGHTVGGILASGLSGPLRLRFGTPREYVIGLRVALPDGRLAASGGRVVKNVSGYDMNKLHLGALGSLGVIVAASFKVFPRPLRELTLQAQPADPWGEAERALALKLPPVALELDSTGVLAARFWGTGESLERMRSELGWPEGDADLWSRCQRRPLESCARISVPRHRLREVLAALPPGAGWWAWPGVGVAHWTGPLESAAVRGARMAAESAGGSLVLLGAPVELKREVGAWGTPPPTLELMRRLRDAFDPLRVISPGRYLV